MAKKQENKAAAPVVKAVKANLKTVVRRKLNTFQRKSLSKEAKRLFAGAPRAVMKALLSAEQTMRRSNKTTAGPLVDA